jgi:hypothetical protein
MRTRKQQKSGGRTTTDRRHNLCAAPQPRRGLLTPIASLAADLAERWICPTRGDSRSMTRRRLARSLEPLEPRQMLAVGLEFEPNDTFLTATDIGVLDDQDIVLAEHDDWTAIEGTISTAGNPGDLDFFTFELRGNGLTGVFFDIDAQMINTPTPELVPTNNLDSIITLFQLADDDVTWNQIAINDDGYDFEGFITPTIPQYNTRPSTANLRDSSMYVELLQGDYAIGVGSFGGQSTGDYELRILADKNFTERPPALHSLTRGDGSPVPPPAGPDFPPNTNLLFLDFFGQFDRGAQPDAFFSFDFDDRLNAPAYDDIPEIRDPFTGEILQEAQDYFTSKEIQDRPLYSPAERLAIKNIWSIVAEDMKPFDINVTTVDLTNGTFRDQEAFRMLVTSYHPENFNWPNGGTGVDEENEFDLGFPTLMGAAAFDSWAEGGGDIWIGPNAERNDQLGYLFAANHENFFDASFGDTPNSGIVMARSIQIANTISMQFGQALGMRKFLLDGPRNNFIMQETYFPGPHLGNDEWDHPPFPIAHDWQCPSGGTAREGTNGGTWRPHDNPENPWAPFIGVPWEGGPDMPHRLTMGLNRVTWGQGRPCDFASLNDPTRVQNDIARAVGLNDPDDQGAGNAVDNSIAFRQDDHTSDPLFGPTSLGSNLRENEIRVGVISELNDLDYFTFGVNRDGPITIKIDVNEYINNLDTQVRVLDARTQGVVYGQSSPTGSFDSQVMINADRQTLYLVEVSTQGEFGELGSYELQILFPEPPRARNDQVTTNEEVAVTIPILANDDPGDDAIDPTSVQIVSQPTNGVVTVDAAGVATYTPDVNFFGTDTFRYNVDNNIGGMSNNATVSIVVVNVPDPPVAIDDSAVTNMDETINIDVLVNDLHPDVPITENDVSSVIVLTAAGNGTATPNADGTISYVPNAGFFGMDSFTYQVSDTATPPLNATATVNVRVNAFPTALLDQPITDEDVPVVIDVLANDFDPDPAPFGGLDASTVTIVSPPINGTITAINAVTGEVSYSPNPEFNGFDSFTYTVDDIDGATSNVGTVDITILFVNDAPVAFDDFFGNDALDVSFDIPVLDNDIDIDPETALRIDSIEIIKMADSGTATPNADGTITYTPNLGFEGGDTFSYRVFDNGSDLVGESDLPSNVATVSVRVGKPITISGYAYIDFNDDLIRQPDELPIADVLVRVTKVDGSFTFSTPLLTDADGFYLLEETPGVNIVPAGVYEISQVQPVILIDGREALGTGNSNPPSNPVIVGNDVFTNILMDNGSDATEFNFGELGLGANFVLDLSGRVFLASSGPNGIAMAGDTLSSLDLTAGQVLVSLPEGWDGVLTASAVLSASSSGTALIELIEVTNNAVNILASSDSSNGAAEVTAQGTLGEPRYLRLTGTHRDVTLNLLGGVADVAPPEAKLDVVTHIAHAGGANGAMTITYRDDVAVDASTIDNFDVRVSGPNGFSALATAVVTSSSASGPSLSVDYLVAAPGGTWDAADSGTYTIRVESNQVTDISGNAVVSQQLGTFLVSIAATAPVAPGAVYFGLEDQTLTVDVASGLLSGVSFSEPLVVSAVEAPSHGTLSLDTNGSFIYQPEANFVGTDSFTYRLAAGSLLSNTATVTIALSNSNDAPTAVNDVFEAVTGEVFDAGLQRLVASGDMWKFVDDGSDQGSAWLEPQFSDDGWNEGRSQLGWGDGDEVTVVSFGDDAENKHVTTYFRRTFEVSGAASIEALYLHLIRDDGAAVYLNGVEIVRDNLAPSAAFDTFALSKSRREVERNFHVFAVDPSLLVEGENVLAVEVHQWRPGTSDMSMDLRLTAIHEPFVGTLTNDVDIDGDVLEAQVTSGPSNGLLTFNPNGTFVYVPNADFVGTDSFRYLASDGQLQSNEAEVTINVSTKPTEPSSDLTGDGFVDFADLTTLLANWNRIVLASEGNLVDPTGSVVNFNDLTVLLADWTGPGPADSPQAVNADDGADRLEGAGDAPQQASDAVFEELGSRSQARRARRGSNGPIVSSVTSSTSHRRTARRLPASEVDSLFDSPLSRRSRHGRAIRRDR